MIVFMFHDKSYYDDPVIVSDKVYQDRQKCVEARRQYVGAERSWCNTEELRDEHYPIIELEII